jgi:Ca2+-binding EF-hand superfamily protein
MPVLWLLLTLTTAAEPGAAADGAVPRMNTAIAAPSSAESPATAADRRDMLLLLDSGPLHLRLHLAIGGKSLAQSRQAYIDRLIKTFDADGDGKLTRSEAARSPLFRTKRRPSANEFLQGLQSQAFLSRRELEQKIDVKGNGLVSFRDISSSANDQEVFKLLDADGSGVLETSELAAAVELILSKDSDGDQCVSFEEFLPPPPPPDPNQPVVLGLDQPITQLALTSKLIVDATNVVFAKRLIDKYDRNRDSQLEVAELGWAAERVKALDANGNGKLDLAELRAIGQTTPDIELSVELAAAQGERGLIQVDGTTGQRLDEAARPDFAKVAFQPAVVTFSQLQLDPQAAAVDDAMRKFNSLDADANGYLTRDETTQALRFERELFELIDADGDEKIFADEMKEYVLALSEPAAATCRINIYDSGYGFFMALDINADGRVSEREKRQAAASLARLERDGSPGIRPNEPVRHFHIEFVRGTYQLFGPSQQPTAQTPTIQRRALTGPIWFQRMDRNNDGDLIWNEFLGPRWVFDQLDADGDELLDSQEAAKWRPKPTQ